VRIHVPALVIATGARPWPGSITKLGNHSFWAIGITAYLKKTAARRRRAAALANHASTRMTQLFECGRDGVSLDGIERILI
jgi:hypothetical protein